MAWNLYHEKRHVFICLLQILDDISFHKKKLADEEGWKRRCKTGDWAEYNGVEIDHI